MSETTYSIARKNPATGMIKPVFTSVPSAIAREAVTNHLADMVDDVYHIFKHTTAEEARASVSCLFIVYDRNGDVVETIDSNDIWGTPEFEGAKPFEFFEGIGSSCKLAHP